MQNYTEFTLAITAYDLATVDDSLNARDSEELLKLLSILEITPLNVSLLEKYESFESSIKKIELRFSRDIIKPK